MEATFQTNMKEFRKKVKEYGRRLDDEGVKRAATDLSYRASNSVKRDFVQSFYQNPSQGSSGRTVRTGRLRASVIPIVRSTAEFGVSSNVIYARIHELGGKTRPHVIYPKNKKALYWAGAKFPVKKVKHPGSTLPARHWMSEPMRKEAVKYIDDQIAKLEKPL